MNTFTESKHKPLLQEISIDRLTRGKYQPRHHFDQEQLIELAASIKSTGGLLQPIIVRPLNHGQYEIIAGERRWRAAQLAQLTKISCLISDYSDEQALQAAMIENLNRTNLNPIEEAQAYQRLINEFHYLHEEVAAAVGKSRTVITNALRLLKLAARVQGYLISGKLNEGQGKILASLPSEQQLALADECVEKNWTVRKLEIEAKKWQQPEKQKPHQDANIKQLEIALSDHMGNQVKIEYAEQGGGQVLMRFNTIDELEGQLARWGFKPPE